MNYDLKYAYDNEIIPEFGPVGVSMIAITTVALMVVLLRGRAPIERQE